MDGPSKTAASARRRTQAWIGSVIAGDTTYRESGKMWTLGSQRKTDVWKGAGARAPVSRIFGRFDVRARRPT